MFEQPGTLERLLDYPMGQVGAEKVIHLVVHCDTEAKALALRAALAQRLGSLGLELHPDKTKIVYCKGPQCQGTSEHTCFDFVGTPLGPAWPGPVWVLRELPAAMSAVARKAKGRQSRAWHLNRRSGTDLSGLAQEINPQVRGWIKCYGACYRSELYAIAARIDERLVRWAMQKFKRLRGRPNKAWRWLDAARLGQPKLFAHWYLLASPTLRLWEAYDGGLSRTVLREREGEVPSRYSPGTDDPSQAFACHGHWSDFQAGRRVGQLPGCSNRGP